MVSKELRELCVFSQHSIVKDPPFSRLDLVSCRNLLIYLDAELQNRVIPIFHFALRPGGYLFLGNAENVSRHAKLFVPVERSFRVFQRIDAENNVHATFPNMPLAAAGRVPAPPQRQRTSSNALVRAGERIADRYAPAYAVLDEHFDVLHFSAQAGRFIRPGSGAPSLNLLNLIHRDLRLDLRSALSRAESDQSPVHVNGVQVHEDNSTWAVDLFVEPTSASEVPRGYVVLFQEVEAREPVELPTPRDTASTDAQVQVLENELRITRERLQSMIEELESTNEELKSSNEEYQSLNEEMQSANEELETSKEELQSVNEEVTTVNGELAHRVQELAQTNSDLKNLLESTQIATVFLDNELHVTNFTPAVTDILPLVESDIHRPISNIKLHVDYDELQDDVHRVIRTLAVLDRGGKPHHPRTLHGACAAVSHRAQLHRWRGAYVYGRDPADTGRAGLAQQRATPAHSDGRNSAVGVALARWRALDLVQPAVVALYRAKRCRRPGTGLAAGSASGRTRADNGCLARQPAHR